MKVVKLALDHEASNIASCCLGLRVFQRRTQAHFTSNYSLYHCLLDLINWQDFSIITILILNFYQGWPRWNIFMILPYHGLVVEHGIGLLGLNHSQVNRYLNWYVVRIYFLWYFYLNKTIIKINKPKMAESRDLAVMDYQWLPWIVMDCHGLS